MILSLLPSGEDLHGDLSKLHPDPSESRHRASVLAGGGPTSGLGASPLRRLLPSLACWLPAICDLFL